MTTIPYAFNVDEANKAMATALTELGVKDTTGPPPERPMARSPSSTWASSSSATTATPATRRASPTWPVPGARTSASATASSTSAAPTSRSSARNARQGNVYDITRNAWGADFPHPDNQLRDLFATGAGNNNSGYANPAFDLLL